MTCHPAGYNPVQAAPAIRPLMRMDTINTLLASQPSTSKARRKLAMSEKEHPCGPFCVSFFVVAALASGIMETIYIRAIFDQHNLKIGFGCVLLLDLFFYH